MPIRSRLARLLLPLLAAACAFAAPLAQAADAAAIVNTFAYQAGLIATRDGIAVEKKENNPYVNVIAVREQDRNAPWVAKLVAAYQSDAVRQFILGKYQGSVLPVF